MIKNKLSIKNLHKSIIPDELLLCKRKKILFLISFYCVALSTFMTIFGQSPMFSSRSITQLFQVGWVISFIPLLMLDYKRVLRGFATIFLFVVPFFVCLIISLAFKVNGFAYSITSYIPLCCFIFTIGFVMSKYSKPSLIRVILGSYIFASVIFALIVYFSKLRGYSISNEIYAFGSKNSASPVFMSAAILSFYLFKGNKPLCIIFRWGLMAFFIIIVALSKTRAVLIVSPIIIFILLFYDIKKPLIAFIILGSFLLFLILIFAIPFLYETIVIKILFNNKRTVDAIFSGRLTQIVVNMQNIKPVFGNGGCYFDCMPLSLLCTYGVIGLISLIPILVFPYFVLFGFKKICSDRRLGEALLVLAIMFLVGSLFEGYGYFGTGAKVFILWLLVGFVFEEFFISKKKMGLFAFLDKQNTIINKTPKIAIIYAMQFILMACALVASSSSGVVYAIGNAIVDRLPATNRVANYIEVKDLEIYNPVGSMCVGQRITFEATARPSNAEDKSVAWSTGWIENPIISVDPVTGEVTANQTGRALLHMNRFRNTNGVYIQYDVLDINDYIFDKFYISTSKFEKSFEHKSNENITILENCTSSIFYDNFYLPDKSKLRYISSNPDIVLIDGDTIRGLSAGFAEISAVIQINGNTYESINKINVNVTYGDFVPTSSISLNIDSQLYRYQEYQIEPVFNERASDTNYKLEINGPSYRINKNLIVFDETGTASITVASLNDPSIKSTYVIEVLDNAPTGFICETNRIKVGQTKNAEELGLYLEFSNGYKKIVTESDLFYDPADFTNRAWSNQNGLVGDNCRTAIKAVKKGDIKLSLISKIDKTIEASFVIKSSVYTKGQYDKLCNDLGVLIVNLLVMVALSFSLFVQFKHKLIIHIYNSVFSIGFLVLIAVKYGVGTSFILSCLFVLICLSAVILIRQLAKDRIPLSFLETPLDFEQNYNVVQSINEYEINI